MVFNSYTAPPPEQPNPFPFSLTVPTGTPGELVPVFKITRGEAFDPLAANNAFRYVVEINAVFAGVDERPDRLETSFIAAIDPTVAVPAGGAAIVVSRTPGYHTHKEYSTAGWDGTGLVVSLLRAGEDRTYTGFITSKRLTHATTIALVQL